MGVGFGGNPVFNRASPSSHATCVRQIVAEFVDTVASRPVRILDIGGTAFGFKQRATLPAGTQVIVANPESGSGADYRFVADIPLSAPHFDLAMLFGVMMYLDPVSLLALMRDVRVRMRGHGTFLVAEPDPEGIVGRVEVFAKSIYAAVKSTWDPTKFVFYSRKETKNLLLAAGFVQVRERQDLTPNAKGVFPPPMPPYYVIAGNI